MKRCNVELPQLARLQPHDSLPADTHVFDTSEAFRQVVDS